MPRCSSQPQPFSASKTCRLMASLATAVAALIGLTSPGGDARADDERGAFSDVVDWPIIAIHTALTPDGRVLSYG